MQFIYVIKIIKILQAGTLITAIGNWVVRQILFLAGNHLAATCRASILGNASVDDAKMHGKISSKLIVIGLVCNF